MGRALELFLLQAEHPSSLSLFPQGSKNPSFWMVSSWEKHPLTHPWLPLSEAQNVLLLTQMCPMTNVGGKIRKEDDEDPKPICRHPEITGFL